MFHELQCFGHIYAREMLIEDTIEWMRDRNIEIELDSDL